MQLARSSALRAKLLVQRTCLNGLKREQVPELGEVRFDILQAGKDSRITFAPRHVLSYRSEHDPGVPVRGNCVPNARVVAIPAYLCDRASNRLVGEESAREFERSMGRGGEGERDPLLLRFDRDISARLRKQ